MTAYCTASDLYSFGLPRGALANPGRTAASMLASTDTVTLDEHGFVDGDTVQFRAEAGGSLPSPLVAGTIYYVRDAASHTFKVAASSGGSAINLTTDGSNVVVIETLPVASAIAWAKEVINDMLPAHVVPFTVVPEIVRMTAAELAVGKIMTRSGAASASLGEMVDAARKRLERWAKGIPIRGTAAATRANKAQAASVPYDDSRGWGSYGGL